MLYIWLWVNTYRYIFSGMNIHLPAILGFTRYQGFDPSPYFYLKKSVNSSAVGGNDDRSSVARGGGRLPRSQTDAMDAGEATPAPAEWADDTPFFHEKRWLEWQGETYFFQLKCYPMMIGMAIWGRYSPTILQLSAILFLRKLVNDEDSEWESPPNWG